MSRRWLCVSSLSVLVLARPRHGRLPQAGSAEAAGPEGHGQSPAHQLYPGHHRGRLGVSARFWRGGEPGPAVSPAPCRAARSRHEGGGGGAVRWRSLPPPGPAAWTSRAPPAGPGSPAPAPPERASEFRRCTRWPPCLLAGEPGARVGPSPPSPPTCWWSPTSDLQMGKLRLRVYSNCSRSQRELAFEPLQCKRKIVWRVHHFAGNSGPTHLRIFNHAPLLDTYSYSFLL